MTATSLRHVRSPFLPILLLLALPLAGCQSMGGETAPAFVAESAALSGQADTLAGKTQFRAGNYGLADEAFSRAVARDPADAEAWLGLGAAHDQLRRFDLSERDYAQVERLSGQTAALLNNRGFSQMLRGNYTKARAELSAAQALDPGNPDIGVNLAAAIRGRRP